MGSTKKIAVIMGGYSSEYEISLKSGEVVCKWLDRDQYDPYRILIRRDKWVMLGDSGREYPVSRHDFSVELEDGTLRFDCVFNAIHGTPGENGLMQAYFELIGMPQTSCGFYQAAVTFNKRDLLGILKSAGVAAARSYHLDRGQELNQQAILDAVGLPCFVKANRAGSSFGVSLVREASGLQAAVESALKEDDEILIEAALQGTEVSVGVIRYQGATRVLPITEIVSENDFFDYQAKYEGKSREITPARIPEDTAEKVRELAARIYDRLRMTGYSRSEFILVDGEPHLLEVNTTPGLTEASILPQQAACAGISLTELFGSAIADALDKNG
ncbi:MULTISPECIES: D-alanine--D-alanine ligase [unclassified Robiginitalea]|uniref:D-alanine--D-alanine ligase n=1 Tax=Robiginitalea TaxID=252306 RepID=UPI002349562D|nr:MULTISPECIES: D-alanine--D-alanine ligase [unclassified Robiginitalea]MDC6354695.1 D-alanine--D-alanine ligase [Robiginitalea sp. PM2]MDC6374623.1 D-alanine--D-alanine ligase [Robiginitalea sp. SP8]